METLVRICGGPFAGDVFLPADAILESGQYNRVATAAVSFYHHYKENPPRAGGWWFKTWTPFPGDPDWSKDAEFVTHYYKVSGGEIGGRLEITCEYGGTEHPTDHTHNDE